jgi:hypothetical protein
MDKKKTPADYPQLAFRIAEDDKQNINRLAEEILVVSNNGLATDSPKFRKNDVLVDALYLGLITLRNKRMKLTR